MGKIILAEAYDEHPFLSRNQLKGCRAPVGFPLPFSDEMQLVEWRHLFLLAKLKDARRINRSGKTALAYAYDLLNADDWIHENGLTWINLSDGDYQEYLSTLAMAISPITNKRYSDATIRRYASTFRESFQWAVDHNLRDKPLKSSTSVILGELDENPLAHLRGGRVRPIEDDLPPRPDPSLKVHPLTIREIEKVFGCLDTSCINTPDQSSNRNKLTSQWGLAVGMRVDEIAKLKRNQIDRLLTGLDDTDPARPVKLAITETKGLKARDVIVPTWLLVSTGAYIEGERRLIIEHAEEYAEAAGNKFKTSSALFLNSIKSNGRDLGNPVKAKTLSHKFAQAVVDAGLVHRESRWVWNEENKMYDEVFVETWDHTIHDLRHTFALLMYKMEVASGNSDPWSKIQGLLGHADVSTTRKIYLKHANLDEAVLSDSLYAYFKGLYQMKL